MVTVQMPQMGETVTEGTVTAWRVAVGDTVAVDDVLAEIATDKVDAEIPSPVAGTVAELLVAEGETVEIGAAMLVIGDGVAAPAPADASVPSPAPASAPEPPAPAPVPPASAARAAAEPERPLPSPAPTREANGFLSPAVRRRLAETGLDPAGLTGSGIGGRITLRDVERALADGVDVTPRAAQTSPAAAAVPAPGPSSASSRPAVPSARAREGDEVIPFSPIRRVTAEHMVRSLATSAHTLVVVEVDYANVDAVRVPAKDDFRARHGLSLTYLPFIARAAIEGLRRFPQLNAVVGDDELIVRADIDLGIAVDLDFEGLIVPIVRGADRLRLASIAVEMSSMAQRARDRELGADDITGGTFTITNAGGYGTLITGPIINQPQVAILSTDGVSVKPVAVPDGHGGHQLAFHPVGNLALSFDHRALDGAYASAFLADVRDRLQTHDWEAEL